LDKKLITSERAMKPVRPYYSQAVSVEGAKRLIFVSGLTWDPKLGGETRERADLQAEFALENMSAILEEAGATMEDIVKITFFVRSIEKDLDKLAEVRYRYFSKSRPSSTLVEVSKLWHPDLLVEVDAIAAAP
jgi:2-iminobutanoate/2-iminopropanoate deaminase